LHVIGTKIQTNGHTHRNKQTGENNIPPRSVSVTQHQGNRWRPKC